MSILNSNVYVNYQEWKVTFYKASTALQMRDKKLEDAAQLIENRLKLLGASAIEDKLQDKVRHKRHKRIYSEKLRTTWARRGFSLILLRIK